MSDHTTTERATTEHTSPGHTVSALIFMTVLVGLIVWGIGVMNDGRVSVAALSAPILFGYGLYVVLSLARD